jgi:hypothetical protein
MNNESSNQLWKEIQSPRESDIDIAYVTEA